MDANENLKKFDKIAAAARSAETSAGYVLHNS